MGKEDRQPETRCRSSLVMSHGGLPNVPKAVLVNLEHCRLEERGEPPTSETGGRQSVGAVLLPCSYWCKWPVARTSCNTFQVVMTIDHTHRKMPKEVQATRGFSIVDTMSTPLSHSGFWLCLVNLTVAFENEQTQDQYPPFHFMIRHSAALQCPPKKKDCSHAHSRLSPSSSFLTPTRCWLVYLCK